MPSILIWTPESDNDREAVCCIAKKIVQFYKSDITISSSTKDAYNQAVQKNSLDKAVNIYLKTSELVIFLIDYDGIQSHAERLKQPNSLVNRITKVVNSIDNAILIYMKQELEAWLLVDCLGICCYFKKDENIRNKQDWIEFAKKNQCGSTDLIAEAISGGKGAKEYLMKILSDRINSNKNSIPSKKLKEKRYKESDSPQVAKYIEINQQTLASNESLKEFAKYLLITGIRLTWLKLLSGEAFENHPKIKLQSIFSISEKLSLGINR
jgi:hypothetical protein